MSRIPSEVTTQLYDYALSVSIRETKDQKELRELTANHPRAIMQVSPDEAQFLNFLIKITGAKKVLEIGTFTGYSALAMALALPDDGTLIACDIDTEYTDIGKPFWESAGVSKKIDSGMSHIRYINESFFLLPFSLSHLNPPAPPVGACLHSCPLRPSWFPSLHPSSSGSPP